MKLLEMKKGKQYIMVPDTDFVKLPDGAIINMAQIRHIDDGSDSIPDSYIRIYTGGEGGWQSYYDPDGKIYDYFSAMAQEIE